MMYMVPYEMITTPLFWVVLFAVPAQAMLIDLLVNYFFLEFRPDALELLMERELAGGDKSKHAQAMKEEHEQKLRKHKAPGAAFRAAAAAASLTRSKPGQKKPAASGFAFDHPDGGSSGHHAKLPVSVGELSKAVRAFKHPAAKRARRRSRSRRGYGGGKPQAQWIRLR